MLTLATARRHSNMGESTSNIPITAESKTELKISWTVVKSFSWHGSCSPLLKEEPTSNNLSENKMIFPSQLDSQNANVVLDENDLEPEENLDTEPEPEPETIMVKKQSSISRLSVFTRNISTDSTHSTHSLQFKLEM